MNGRNLKDLEAKSSLQFKDRPLKDEIRYNSGKFMNPGAGFGSEFKRILHIV